MVINDKKQWQFSLVRIPKVYQVASMREHHIRGVLVFNHFLLE
jgi:hypothetical protein